jgi:hypothetical protein
MEFLDYGFAVGIALLARREFREFRDLFQRSLDALKDQAARSETRHDATDARLSRLEEAVSKTNESVAGLAMVVASAIEFEGEDEVASDNLEHLKGEKDAPN